MVWSKRPLRQKLMVVATGVVISAAIAVPLAIGLVGRTDGSTTAPSDVVSEEKAYQLYYGGIYVDSTDGKAPAEPESPAEGYELTSTKLKVTAAPGNANWLNASTLGGDLIALANAGTSWTITYRFTSGSKPAMTVVRHFTVIKLPVTPLTLSQARGPDVKYGLVELPASVLANEAILPKAVGYDAPTLKDAIYYSDINPSATTPVVKYDTIPAGNTIVATYEYVADSNHSGASFTRKVAFYIDAAEIDALPSVNNGDGLTATGAKFEIQHGGDAADMPGPTAAQKDAAKAANYTPYALTSITVKSAPAAFVAPTITGAITAALATSFAVGTVFTVVYTAQYDPNDNNHTAPDSTVTNEVTVVQGNATGVAGRAGVAVDFTVDISKDDSPMPTKALFSQAVIEQQASYSYSFAL